MRLQSRQIMNYFSELQNLSKDKFPIELAFKIDILKQNLERYVLDINENIEEVRLKYAKKDEKGEYLSPIDENGRMVDGYVFNTEDIVSINNETNFLLDEVVEVPIFNLKISEFPKDFLISVDSVSNLRGLLVLN
jgi:hypothetical protein